MTDGISRDIKGSFIKEISDADGTNIKIGFISVCIPSNPKEYVLYKDMFSSIQKEYDLIKEEVDVVLGLTHVKIEHDREIARLLPNIPLIMGGHEHDHKNEMIGDVKITKADANAKTAYIHTINFDKKTKETTISSLLKTIDTSIVDDKKVPVIAPLGLDANNQTYNINADTAAGSIAIELKARRLMIISDVEGVLDSEKKLIPEINSKKANELIDQEVISGGMIPKIKNCLDVASNGVKAVVIIDGRKNHSLLFELLSDKGSGTLIRE